MNYAKITPDGEWWINLGKRGWIPVEEIMRRLDRVDETWRIAALALSLAAGALTGVVFLIVVVSRG